MKRTHIMIAVFFACILSPNLLFPILKTTADEGTGENRSLAAFPTLSLETIDTFPSGVEDWINDHAAFRNRFLSLNARLNLSLFQFGDSQDVITGKDGWYFYTLGSSVEDFLGTNRFSAGELQMLADKLQTVHDAWEEKGTEFIFLCAPNKEGIYSEFLPDGFTAPDGPTRRSELLDYLEIHTNVPVVNPYPELKNRRDYQWYFKTDTHWNHPLRQCHRRWQHRPHLSRPGARPATHHDLPRLLRHCPAGRTAEILRAYRFLSLAGIRAGIFERK